MHSSQSCAPPRRRGGFTLVEIMIVVCLIGMLALLALPAFKKVRRNAQSNRFVSDLRTFAQQFESYSLQNGAWPATAGNSVVPPEMTGDLKRDAWIVINSIGGVWSWEFDSSTGTADIGISGVTATDSQMIQIDARIDDGDLTGGLFQKRNPGQYVYYLQRP